jgi:hypothetical protein
MSGVTSSTRALAASQVTVVAIFLACVAAQWHGPGFLPGTDAIAYITSGVNLIAHGRYLNAADQPELWFPPLYPILIGSVSIGGRLDPTGVAHGIALASAVLGLFMTGYLARLVGGKGYEPALAMALLALNPVHQGAAVYALSEATATLLGLCGFAIWLRLADGAPLRQYALLGLLVGLSYLTRPEGLLLLPIWAAFDLLRGKGAARFLAGYTVAGLVTVSLMLPYVIYLYEHTGRVTLTGKTAINLVSGRATYYSEPTEYIDPSTLEVGLWKHDVTFLDEAGRYAWNTARILASYARHLIAILAVPILVGLASFANRRQLRFLVGGAAFVVYVILLVVFQVKNRFLHLSTPFLSILAARGLVHLFEAIGQTSGRRWHPHAQAAAAWAICAATIVQSMLVLRQNIEDGSGSPLLRDAGQELGRLAPTRGVVFDQWGHIAFHAHQESRILTPNDIQTLLRYIEKHMRPGQPVYLALSSIEADWYHPSVRVLLESSDGYPQLRRLFSLSDSRGLVVVYEVRPVNGSAAE